MHHMTERGWLRRAQAKDSAAGVELFQRAKHDIEVALCSIKALPAMSLPWQRSAKEDLVKQVQDMLCRVFDILECKSNVDLILVGQQIAQHVVEASADRMFL